MKFNKLSSIICLGILVVSFQNCGRSVGFSSDSSNSAAKVLGTSGSSSTGDASGNLVQDGTQICVANTDDDRDHADHVCHHEPTGVGMEASHATHADIAVSHDEEEDGCEKDDVEGSNELVACILMGQGKSEKLGLVAGKLGPVEAVSDSVCITRNECLGEVAKAFNVRGAYERGYCEHNPNVTRLTDAQVHALLAP